MNTGSDYLTVSGINVDVVYKDIKNLHISVYPPLGRVRVAAPLRLDEDSIRLAIVQRLSWIKKQREQLQATNRLSEREMVSGESHYLWGERLRLKVSQAEGRPSITKKGKNLEFRTNASLTQQERMALLENWYRKELKRAVPQLIEKWELVIGEKVERWTIRRMKTKWGSCNPSTKSIWINIELVKKQPQCLEYIVVHEMTHFMERTHNEDFVQLMNKHLPTWRAIRDQLNSEPLKTEKWEISA